MLISFYGWNYDPLDKIFHLYFSLFFYRPNVFVNRNIFDDLPFPQTSPGFYVSAVQVFWKHSGKRRNCS